MLAIITTLFLLFPLSRAAELPPWAADVQIQSPRKVELTFTDSGKSYTITGCLASAKYDDLVRTQVLQFSEIDEKGGYPGSNRIVFANPQFSQVKFRSIRLQEACVARENAAASKLVESAASSSTSLKEPVVNTICTYAIPYEASSKYLGSEVRGSNCSIICTPKPEVTNPKKENENRLCNGTPEFKQCPSTAVTPPLDAIHTSTVGQLDDAAECAAAARAECGKIKKVYANRISGSCRAAEPASQSGAVR